MSEKGTDPSEVIKMAGHILKCIYKTPLLLAVMPHAGLDGQDDISVPQNQTPHIHVSLPLARLIQPDKCKGTVSHRHILEPRSPLEYFRTAEGKAESPKEFY